MNLNVDVVYLWLIHRLWYYCYNWCFGTQDFHAIVSHQLLNDSRRFSTTFPCRFTLFLTRFTSLGAVELGAFIEVCHQEPTLGLLCLSLSHRRAVQVSEPQGSVTDKAMRAPSFPTGFRAVEKGQKAPSAPVPSTLNGSPLGTLKGSFISLPGNRM